MFTKKEKNIILTLALIILIGAVWFLIKKYIICSDPVNLADLENKNNFSRQEEQFPVEVITENNKVNINADSFERIEALPYIGRKRAEDIIEYRKANGNFHKLEDLTSVKGIGLKTIEKLKPLVTF